MPRASAKRRAEGSPPCAPAPKRFSSSFNETITVLVGPDEDRFTVHKTTACKTSPFFEAACSRRWTEGREKTVQLPDADPRVFETWLHWAYEKELNLVEVKPEPSEAAESSSAQGLCHPSYRDLCDLWAPGNYLQDRLIRNRVIDKLLEKFDATPKGLAATATINHAWGITPPDSTLRRLLLDVHLARATPANLDTMIRSWPQEFVRRVAMNWLCSIPRRDPGPTSESRCRYHEHEEGEGECV